MSGNLRVPFERPRRIYQHALARLDSALVLYADLENTRNSGKVRPAMGSGQGWTGRM